MKLAQQPQTTKNSLEFLSSINIKTKNIKTKKTPLEMKKQAEEVFLQAIEDKKFLKAFKEKSKLTEADALRIGKEVNKAVSTKLRKMTR